MRKVISGTIIMSLEAMKEFCAFMVKRDRHCEREIDLEDTTEVVSEILYRNLGIVCTYNKAKGAFELEAGYNVYLEDEPLLSIVYLAPYTEDGSEISYSEESPKGFTQRLKIRFRNKISEIIPLIERNTIMKQILKQVEDTLKDLQRDDFIKRAEEFLDKKIDYAGEVSGGSTGRDLFIVSEKLPNQ
jgi:hypothetical protein